MTRIQQPRHPASGARCGLVWLATTAVVAPLLTWLGADLLRTAPDTLATQRFDLVLVVACEAAAALGVGWLWVLVTLVTLDAARGLQRRRAGVPAFVRRGVLVACGLGLAGGIAAPAYSDAPDRTPGPGGDMLIAGLQLPDRTTSSRGPEVHTTPTVGQRASRTVVVAPGDTLWDLAAADLPPHPEVHLIDAHWRAIHAANRDAIGPDPDLIHPGQRLRLPPPPPGTDT